MLRTLAWALAIPSFLGIVILGVIALMLAVKPAPEPRVTVIKEFCENKACTKRHTDVADVVPVTKDLEAQQALAEAVLPTIIRDAFSISTAGMDEGNWRALVTPFLLPKSNATNFFKDYLLKNNIGQLSERYTVDVTVDPIDDKSVLSPNQFIIGWKTKTSDGQQASFEHYSATVSTAIGPQTESNPNGIYLTNIAIDAHQKINAQEWGNQ